MVSSFEQSRLGRQIRQIATVGSSVPRQCGIATFTDDLTLALLIADSDVHVDSIAMNDRNDYTYSDRVAYEISDRDPLAYRHAADFINRYGYDVVSIQHEYGIFGGDGGSYLLGLVREVRMPVVTTLHTVLKEPTPSQKHVMDELLQLSERVVVMSQKAVGYLKEVHDVSADKIDHIPHGIPEILTGSGDNFRAQLQIDGPMILTFGLLSPDKGIQHVIQAMPKIVEQHPGATYVVVGATHPQIRAQYGEAYRESLLKLAIDLGVAGNIRFLDRFVTREELAGYLGAMDIYITPYLNPKQITSGTLAYAIGAGKAVISTPYTYAEELLADGRGVLVPFQDCDAISDAVLKLQNEPKMRLEMGKKAADFGRQMLWPEVAKSYLNSFARAKADSAGRLKVVVQRPVSFKAKLPYARLDHLFDLSDDTGIFQHATFTVPNRAEGYCVDDNARALLLTSYLEGPRHLPADVSLLQNRYLSFVLDAYNTNTGRFRNFMSYGRNWLEEGGSEDSQGRSLWALGAMVNRCRDPGRRDLAKSLFDEAAPTLLETSSLRTWAYVILAAEEYLKQHPLHSEVKSLMKTMATRLKDQFENQRSSEWPWFEQSLSYANARIPQAMILAGTRLKDGSGITIGLESLSWLMKIQTSPDGYFAPIGSNCFYVRHKERCFFDQQPVEAAATISACLAAARVSSNPIWTSEAQRTFRWFLGENMLQQPLYDERTGGCYDGLHSDRVNRNQGAESTLSFHCALAELNDDTSVTAESAATTGFAKVMIDSAGESMVNRSGAKIL